MPKFLIFCLALLVMSFPAFAQDRELITVSDAYAFATSPVQKNGAVFATFTNLGNEHLSGKNLVILSAESDIADRVELHTHEIDGDVMMMRKVDRFDLNDSETLTLKPSAEHIMLFDIKEPLRIGDTFPMTVFIGDGFQHGYGGVTFDVHVIAPGTQPAE